ncbi:MAG: thiamine pyrophosphate-binding protein, partial [Isosphaeraceae bacterium]|nr:thiamine pyrophosphate-binding protein [Isosphaeraceae bacterium]
FSRRTRCDGVLFGARCRSVRVADYVMQRIAEAGVRHVFMVAGGGAMHLDDALGRRNDIEYVCTLHEQAAAIAAEAYARVTNNLGVVLVTTGPGGTNALTGVAGAWLESTPCLVISGQVKRTDMKGSLAVRQLGPQELDIVALAAPITKYAKTVMDPNDIAYEIDRALHIARSGRPGPVWLDIPLDVQGSQVDPASIRRFEATDAGLQSPSELLATQVEGTVRLLNRAQRPVLLVGNGVRLAGASARLLDLVDTLGIPVLTTWMGADLLWESHPLFFGKPGTVAARGANFTIQNADLLISIGARLDAAVTGFDKSQFARAARKVIVDVEPGEIDKLGIKVDVPITIDAARFIEAVLSQRDRIEPKDRAAWLDRCADWKRRYPVVLPEYWTQADHANTYAFADVLAEELSGDDLIIPGSSGVAIDTFWLAFSVKKGQRLFSTGGLGAMGFGLPASIGGCLAAGGRRTISVDGDGGFQLNVQELETVRRLQLPIKFFVLNNNGYASIRATQRNHFHGHLVGADPTSGLTLPSLKKLGEAFGISVATISDNSQLREGIREVLDQPGPVLCDVLVAPDQPIGPRVSSTLRADGSMVSRPLEDLLPLLDRSELRANMLVPLVEDGGQTEATR